MLASLVEPVLWLRVRRVGGVRSAAWAQRHRALLSEMLTRPWMVEVIRDRSPGC